MPDEKLIERPLPMSLNLGEFSTPDNIIGYASVYQMIDGCKRISIVLDKKTSETLTNLVDVFELKGIDFVGVKRRN